MPKPWIGEKTPVFRSKQHESVAEPNFPPAASLAETGIIPVVGLPVWRPDAANTPDKHSPQTPITAPSHRPLSRKCRSPADVHQSRPTNPHRSCQHAPAAIAIACRALQTAANTTAANTTADRAGRAYSRMEVFCLVGYREMKTTHRPPWVVSSPVGENFVESTRPYPLTQNIGLLECTPSKVFSKRNPRLTATIWRRGRSGDNIRQRASDDPNSESPPILVTSLSETNHPIGIGVATIETVGEIRLQVPEVRRSKWTQST